MHAYLLPLQARFLEYADEQIARASKAYLRDQFEHYGMKTDLRRRLCRDYMKEAMPVYGDLPKIVRESWKLPQREWQYFGVELIAAQRKSWDLPLIALIEHMITHKSWWDSVDQIASELTGPFFTMYPKQIASVTSAWNKSDNIWLQRSSIMFQKSYRAKTNEALLSRYILRLANSDEFFVQKAIGWALREYSKTNPQWVKNFVKKNTHLPPLSKREALKRIKK